MLGIPARRSPSLAIVVFLAALACAERRPNSKASPIHVGGAPPPASAAAPSSSNPSSTPGSVAMARRPSGASGTVSTGGTAPATGGTTTGASVSASVSGPAPSAPAPSGSQPGASSLSASASSTPDRVAPSLLDSDGKPLSQTEDRPSVDSAAFKLRIEQLAQAITRDDPSLARLTFFPVVAYEQVKAIAKPARDWQHRLMRDFEADVHEYHRALGPNPEQARLAGIDVPERSARWMKPGSEGNRLGYFRVLRSRLRFTKADGKERTFEVTSMISWRGEWYVVHLNGFE